MSQEQILTPRLIVSSSADAIRFYETVFGAEEVERYANPEGVVIHAAVSIRGTLVSMADAVDGWYPESRSEGSPILLTLNCDDPDAVAKRAEENGATIVIPVADRFYGRREGRICDPFGHLWILSRPLDNAPSPEDIQRGVDEFE